MSFQFPVLDILDKDKIFIGMQLLMVEIQYNKHNSQSLTVSYSITNKNVKIKKTITFAAA